MGKQKVRRHLECICQEKAAVSWQTRIWLSMAAMCRECDENANNNSSSFDTEGSSHYEKGSTRKNI